MRFLILILLLFGSPQLFAQASAPEMQRLAQSDKITWWGTVEMKYVFSKSHHYWEEREQRLGLSGLNRLYLLKYQNEQLLGHYENLPHYLSQQLLALAQEGQPPLYKDRDCQQPFSEEEREKLLIRRIDTSGPLNPWDRSLEGERYDTLYFQAQEIAYYRVFQSVYYDASAAQFKAVVHAVAPVWLRPADGNALDREKERQTLFWMPVQMRARDWSSRPAVTWGMGIQRDMDFADVALQKGSADMQPLLRGMLQRIREKEMPLWASWMENLQQPYPLDRMELRHDSETFEERKVKVGFEEDIEVALIRSLRWYQGFFWDAQKQRLLVQNKGFFPLQSQEDHAGNFLFPYPLFFKAE